MKQPTAATTEGYPVVRRTLSVSSACHIGVWRHPDTRRALPSRSGRIPAARGVTPIRTERYLTVDMHSFAARRHLAARKAHANALASCCAQHASAPCYAQNISCVAWRLAPRPRALLRYLLRKSRPVAVETTLRNFHFLLALQQPYECELAASA